MKSFPKPPIVEASIDIRTNPSADVTINKLSDWAPADFGSKKEQFLFQGQFQSGAEPSASAVQHQLGFIYQSQDGKKLLQSRLNGFTLSCLAPYPGWEGFRAEACSLWDEYSAIATPAGIERIGVRYVNRIEIPLPVLDFKDWLKTYPEVSEGVGANLSGFFMQVQIPQQDLHGVAIINETITSSPDPEKVVIILLDIDLARTSDVPQESRELWEAFETLRDRKNDIFLACITEKTEELFR